MTGRAPAAGGQQAHMDQKILLSDTFRGCGSSRATFPSTRSSESPSQASLTQTAPRAPARQEVASRSTSKPHDLASSGERPGLSRRHGRRRTRDRAQGARSWTPPSLFCKSTAIRSRAGMVRPNIVMDSVRLWSAKIEKTSAPPETLAPFGSFEPAFSAHDEAAVRTAPLDFS